METVVINGTPRTELGKKATRALRKAGNVPCNLYGGKETLNFYAPVAEFRKLIYTPEFRVAEVNLNGTTYKAIVKDSQFHSVNDSLLHLDFQELVEGSKVKVSIPLKLKGTPKGIVLGGKLEQVFRKLNILALPKDLINEVVVDIADMDLGAIKRIKDLEIPGVTFLHSPSNPFVKLMIPRKVAEVAPTAAAAPAAAAPAAAKAEDKKDEKKK
ncbi:MAG TPA: 50S ribosomal protein L25 [Chitinophagales bacterium]|nr:50S ribosomal protein L25 [Chitinophagales bacterium]